MQPNFLLNISNGPSSSWHISCSACIRVSKSCRPCLDSPVLYNWYFFYLTYIKVWKMFLPLVWSFLITSVYLSLELQLNVGCLMVGLLTLGPTFSVLGVPVMDMICIATLAALVTVYAKFSLEFVCSFAISASLSDCYCILVLSLPCETALFYHLDLLRLLILSLTTILCLSLPLSDSLLLTPHCISCLNEDNTDVCLYVNLLLCANNFY